MPGEVVTLTNDLQGYYARPQGKGSFPAVMVFMEGFGLNDFIVGVCSRLAEAGYAALAPDFYHGDTFQYTDFQSGIAKLKALKDDTLMAETGMSLGFLTELTEVDSSRIGALGFCMGGRLAFLAASVHAYQIKAAVCFYGGGIAPEQDPFGRPQLLDRVEAIQAPLLLGYGAQDTTITPLEHGRIAQALSAAKTRYTLSVFPNVGHGFLSIQRDSYATAAKEAWQMTMNFFSQHLV